MTRGLELLAKGFFLLGLLASPVLAQELEEPNGYPITDVNLRAGPGTEYPVLVTVPTDAPITILGCLEDYTWCDTIFEEQRGWMSSIYLAGYYDGEYYLLSDYAPDLGYQVVTFDRAAYWDAYYQDEPFYDDRSRVTEARGEDWVDEGVFYDRLSPHGAWTWTQGQYVWVPTGVDSGWRPYTRGRWVYTDYGWTWASDEPFGWATYHYGRWGFSHSIGWFWVPGNRWGPAWVSWRQSDDYLAWAPLPPAYDRGGLSINVSFGDIPSYYWSGVPSRYFLSDDLSRYYVRDRARWRNVYDRTRPIGHTTIINNSVVNNVVNVNYVEQHTNQTVVERNVRRTRDWDRAGKIHGDDYEVYRPGLREGRGHHRPEKIRDIDEVAKLSKTRNFARGEPATADLLAPPEVREAIKRRKGGRARGEDIGPREVSRGEPDRPKFDRRLPKGRDAEGPPPARKKARAEPLPAHDLGRSRGGPDGKRVRRAGPQERATSPDRTGSPWDRAKTNDQKRPPQARSREEGPAGPKGPPRERAKASDQKGPPQARSREEGPAGPKGPPRERAKAKDQKSPAAMQARSTPKAKPSGKPKASAQQAKRKPQAMQARSTPKAKPRGKPKASAQQAKRKPQAMQARSTPKAKPRDKPKASAQQAKRKPQAMQARSTPKAKPRDKPKASAQQAKRKPQAMQARSTPKAKPREKPKASAQQAKRKPQAMQARSTPKAKPRDKPKASAQQAKRKPQAMQARSTPKAKPRGKPKASAQQAKRKSQAKQARSTPKAKPSGKPKASAQKAKRKPQAKNAQANPKAAKQRTADNSNKRKKN